VKVIQVISSFSPGGAEVLVKNLAIKLSKKIDVEVWAMAKSKDESFEKKYMQELEQYHVRMFQFNKEYLGNRIKIIFKLREKIRMSKPDIINTHLEYINIYTVMASLGLGIPIVHTVHNIKIKYAWIYRFFLKYFTRKFVAISVKIGNIIQEQLNLPPNKIRLIFNGINLQEYNGVKRKERGNVSHIIAVGRLLPQKDYPNLLGAYKKLVFLLSEQCIEPPQLNIVGDGRLKKDLMKMVDKLNITSKVNFLGIRTDIPHLLANSDLYIMASKWEGFSISLIEALASGIPIIATSVGSNGELIENNKNGVLVIPGRPDLLAKAMLELILNKELRRRFSKNGSDTAKKFSIEACTEGYLKLYFDLINR